MIYTVVVTCCDHPDNDFDEIPGAVWASYWSKDSLERDATLTVSQVVPLTDGEPVRYFEDWHDGKPSRVRVRAWEDQGPHRERIRESCAACGRTLLMRDETWNVLSRKLESLAGIWHPQILGDTQSVEATISLPMLARLAEEVKSSRGQLGQR